MQIKKNKFDENKTLFANRTSDPTKELQVELILSSPASDYEAFPL
jgi:hypothetical protein